MSILQFYFVSLSSNTPEFLHMKSMCNHIQIIGILDTIVWIINVAKHMVKSIIGRGEVTKNKSGYYVTFLFLLYILMSQLYILVIFKYSWATQVGIPFFSPAFSSK